MEQLFGFPGPLGGLGGGLGGFGGGSNNILQFMLMSRLLGGSGRSGKKSKPKVIVVQAGPAAQTPPIYYAAK